MWKPRFKKYACFCRRGGGGTAVDMYSDIKRPFSVALLVVHACLLKFTWPFICFGSSHASSRDTAEEALQGLRNLGAYKGFTGLGFSASRVL